MTIIFLAECENRSRADVLSQYFDTISWSLKDSNTKIQCYTEIKQDFERNWWCSLSVNAMDWSPTSRQEANYRHYQLLELQSLLLEQLKSAPTFRYALVGEIGGRDSNYLLDNSSSNYRITYSHLFPSKSSNQFNIPIFIYILKVGFLLSRSLWLQIGSPSKFEPLIDGYVWLPPAPTVVWGGMSPPLKENINQTEVQVMLSPQEAENYDRKGMELVRERRFAEALVNLERAQQLNPLCSGIHQNKAVALYFLERFSEALQHCDFSITLNPSVSNLVILYQLKGDIFYAQKQLEKSLESFQDSLDLNPDASYALHPHRQKVLILEELGRYQEALDACEFALKQYPNEAELHELKLKILASFNQESQDSVTCIVSGEDHRLLLDRFRERFSDSPQKAFNDPAINLALLEENSESFTAFFDSECPSSVLTQAVRDEKLPMHWQIWLTRHPSRWHRERIAHSPYLSEESIRILANDENDGVRGAIAENRSTPSEILNRLSTDKDRIVRLNVSRHTNAPSDALINLVTDQEWGVRKNLAQNLNTPVDVLIRLAKDQDWRVRTGIAENPNTPVETLVQLIEDADNSVRMKVAANSNLPSDLLVSLAKSKDDLLRYGVARNQNTPTDVLVKLANNEDRSVLSSVAQNPNTPEHVLAKLAKSKYFDVRVEVAKNPNAPKDALFQLIRYKDEVMSNDVILSFVVAHPNASKDVLAIALTALARDQAVRSRFLAAGNIDTPREILAQLINDVEPDVRDYACVNLRFTSSDQSIESLFSLMKKKIGLRVWVAKQPSALPELLSRLAEDQNEIVRQIVAINLNTSVDRLVRLAEDENKKTRLFAAINSNTHQDVSERILINFANDGDARIRLFVAKFSRTPAALLMKLTQDADSEVRRASADTLSTINEV